MDNKLVLIPIAAVIGIIVLGSVLMPILDDATATTDTFKNDDYFITMDKMDADSEHTITWNKETATKITVDGVDISPDWNNITIVAEEDNLVRCTKATAPSNEYYLSILGAARPQGAGSLSDKSVTITISGGVLTFSGVTSADSSYSFTSPFTEGYVINPDSEGDYQYIMKTPTAKAYVLGDSEIYGVGYSTVGGTWQNVFVISGTIEDGINVELISTTLETEPTISNQVTYSTEIEGYKSLYQFEKVTFDAEYGGQTTLLTYSYVIVPAEVNAEKSVHLTDGENAILGAIPIMIIVAILLGVVAFVVRSRMN